MKLRPADNHSVRSITRRALLLGVSLMVVAGLLAPVAHARPAAPTATEQPLRPTLPPPTGHHRIGVVQLHLLDHTRPDPWVPRQTVQELMVSLEQLRRRTPAALKRLEQLRRRTPAALKRL